MAVRQASTYWCLANIHAQNDHIHGQNDCLHAQNDCLHAQNDCLHAQNNCIHLLLLWKVFRFVGRVQHFEAWVVELCIFLILVLMFCFLDESTSGTTASYSIIGLSIFGIGILYVDTLWRSCFKCLKKCLHKKCPEKSIHQFTRVRAIDKYKIEAEDSKDDTEQLQLPNLSVFTSRPNSGSILDPTQTANVSGYFHTYT